jgi:hypothetical protein
MLIGATLAALVLLPALRAGAAGTQEIGFPTDYRQWAHVKSAVIAAPHPFAATEAGIHHVYANALALEGLRGGTFAPGATLVYDLLDVRADGGLSREDARRRLDVMVKTTESANGGWRYARFMGDDRAHGALAAKAQADCAACHASAKAHGGVFSEWRG